MRLIDCDISHLPAITAILNDGIATTTAVYDYEPRTAAAMEIWFAAKQLAEWPVIGAFNDVGNLLGYGSYGPFRGFAAYRFTVEHSLYVAPQFQRRGVGEVLLKALIDRATAQRLRVMVGAIDSQNAASAALHEKLGFSLVGTLPEVGFKFGKWLDLLLYQRILTADDICKI